MQIKDSVQSERIVFLDYLRVMACFMVIMVHSCEFFFINGDSIGIRTVSGNQTGRTEEPTRRHHIVSYRLFIYVDCVLSPHLHGYRVAGVGTKLAFLLV